MPTSNYFLLTFLTLLISVLMGPSLWNAHTVAYEVASVPTNTVPQLKREEKESLVVTSKYYIGPEDVLDISPY